MNPDFYRSQIERIPGRKQISGSRVMILCPFHSETKPSGSILLDTSKPGSFGKFKCWGCGKFCSWNEFAEKLGLQKIKNGKRHISKHVPQIDLNGAKHRVLPKEDEKIEDYDFFELQEPKWRGFKKEFLEKIGAKLAYHDKSQMFWTWFPVMVNGEQVGYIRARQKKTEDLPSYLNMPGEWVKAKGLFPFDTAVKIMRKKGLKTMVLVEGPRDALRLIRAGIPAVSIMGTNNWTDSKRQIVEGAGVRRLVLLMDGDKAGKRATYGNPDDKNNRGIYEAVKLHFDVVVFKLWKTAKRLGLKKVDPYSMPIGMVEKVRNRLR